MSDNNPNNEDAYLANRRVLRRSNAIRINNNNRPPLRQPRRSNGSAGITKEDSTTEVDRVDQSPLPECDQDLRQRGNTI